MRSNLQVPLSVLSSNLKPAGTGSQKIHVLTTKFEYRGDAGLPIFDFLYTIGSGSCVMELDIPEPGPRKPKGDPTRLRVTGKFTAGGMKFPKKREERSKVAITFTMSRDDVREMQELQTFLFKALGREALELEASFEAAQGELFEEKAPEAEAVSA